MSQPPKNTHPAVTRSLDLWHAMIAKGDLAGLKTIVHPEAVFRSPMALTPYPSPQAVILVLSTVVNAFENFTYHRQLAGYDGLDVVLEFSANIGDKKLKGIDFIRFDEQGKIVEFEVMVRPMSGLQALGMEMGKRLGDKLPTLKGQA